MPRTIEKEKAVYGIFYYVRCFVFCVSSIINEASQAGSGKGTHKK
jgi:hypothetical protein